jgi:hypothetical protein
VLVASVTWIDPRLKVELVEVVNLKFLTFFLSLLFNAVPPSFPRSPVVADADSDIKNVE